MPSQDTINQLAERSNSLTIFGKPVPEATMPELKAAIACLTMYLEERQKYSDRFVATLRSK